ncbi:MAG TPA: beta-ketoacyl-ACP synthase II [Gemmatimonadaceae bacterium]|nr:beta-ketoacyl-ACP synthase II [Gemmatimonadaceae bacterium]
MNPDRRRVVVTGLGAVTPIGLTAPEFWECALKGESGAAPITRFDASALPTRFACELKGFDPFVHLDRKLANRLDPVLHYALVAAKEAIADAGLDPARMPEADRERAGVIFGSGIGGIVTFERNAFAYKEGGVRKLSPFFIPLMMANMGAGMVAMELGFRGINHAVVSACATGNHSLADALLAIRAGDADLVVAGGTEAAVCELGVAGFNAMKALSTRNDDPARASRPFDRDRDGFVMGEGAGALVLESLERATERGARIYAELLSVGASSDAHPERHLSAPHPEGLGAFLAMQRALADGGIAPEEVHAINMHGTSTPLGDAMESRAVRRAFGGHADQLTATSTKGMTGHLLGAAGAVEAILSVLSIVHGVVPPSINIENPDPECDLVYAANAPVRREVRVAMSNAFGFGGHNTSALFAALDR